MSVDSPGSAARPPTPLPHRAVETEVFNDQGFVAVLLDERDGRLHTLNSASAAVWVLLDGETSADSIAAELAEMFGESQHRLDATVRQAIEEFWQLGLLEGSPATPSLATADSEARGERLLARAPDP